MACAIHGTESLCGPTCEGYIAGTHVTTGTPQLAPDNGADAQHRAELARSGNADMQACYDLMHNVMTAHEETRGHFAAWVDSIEARVNMLAAQLNEALNGPALTAAPAKPDNGHALDAAAAAIAERTK